jgi:hypothetical protein
MKNNKCLFSKLILGCLLIVLAGCASPASKEGMVAHNVPVSNKFDKTITVRTQGGSETGVADSSNIDNKDLASAIEQSIIENGLFTQVIHGNDSDYLLSVSIIDISKPMFGASFTVTLEAGWALMEQKTKKVIMKDSIKTSYTATMGQSLIGVKRLRLAVEGTVRENIKQGLLKISELPLN